VLAASRSTVRLAPRIESRGTAAATLDAAPVGRTVAVFREMLDEKPADKKARLVQRIRSVVGVPIAEWVAGLAANLVVYQEVPIRDLEHIFIDLDAKRAKLTNPAAWFHYEARKLAERYGKPWPRRDSANRASEALS
jgi:hypothetical protein